jgi:hypothetical protein
MLRPTPARRQHQIFSVDISSLKSACLRRSPCRPVNLGRFSPAAAGHRAASVQRWPTNGCSAAQQGRAGQHVLRQKAPSCGSTKHLVIRMLEFIPQPAALVPRSRLRLIGLHAVSSTAEGRKSADRKAIAGTEYRASVGPHRRQPWNTYGVAVIRLHENCERHAPSVAQGRCRAAQLGRISHLFGLRPG